ncbi:putative ribonuclease H-like domain-containing protein [Tanacetum coccineum]|uniref:Ribonuclease H-like domain-containing protein n=1 Tax=Tanacetum coccineum TaxID=301880 RepID=A0ABQ5HIP8_9ASTR
MLFYSMRMKIRHNEGWNFSSVLYVQELCDVFLTQHCNTDVHSFQQQKSLITDGPEDHPLEQEAWTDSAWIEATQEEGIDFEESFTPVARLEAVRKRLRCSAGWVVDPDIRKKSSLLWKAFYGYKQASKRTLPLFIPPIVSSIHFLTLTHADAVDTRKHFWRDTVPGDNTCKLDVKETNLHCNVFIEDEYVELSDKYARPEDRFLYLVRRIGMRCLTPAELEELVAKAMDDVSRQAFEEEKRRIASQKKAAQATSTNQLSTDRPFVSTDRSFVSTDRSNTPNVSAASTSTGANADESSFVYLGGKIPIDASTLPNADLPIDPNMPDLEDASDTLPNDGIFNGAYDDDEDVGAVADFNNMDNTIAVSPIPTLRIHKDHPKGQILGDPTSIVQTRGKIQKASSAQQALVWILVDLPYGKKVIGTKWVFRNKRDKRSVVLKNKARLVAQGHRQEEGIDYDEVFALVARIEAIRLFLAFASYMGFLVYQMDVKSAFLYGTIGEEVYVYQPPDFIDPAYPNKVYKVIKALYGLHQAPRAWYETLSSFLLENGFKIGTIDKTLFIKKNKSDIMLVQVYVDDIIFGSTKKSMCTEFEEVMHKRFQMSSMRELTFFLGLQVKQQPDGIFISQDKYVADILKKFDFCSIKTANTPIESNKPLVKDEDGVEVDVHEY